MKPYKLSSKALITLEKLILKNMLNNRKFHIYDIYGGNSKIEVGPELCMYDVLSREDLLTALYNSGNYFLSYNFVDLKHHVYLRLSNKSTTLSISGTDEAWVIGKSKQLRKFLDANKNSALQEEVEQIKNLKTYKPKRGGKTPLNKAGDILSACAVVALILTIILCIWYFIGAV